MEAKKCRARRRRRNIDKTDNIGEERGKERVFWEGRPQVFSKKRPSNMAVEKPAGQEMERDQETLSSPRGAIRK